MTSLAHVALWTRDLDEAGAFWQRVFGATVGETYRSKRRPGYASRFVVLPGGGASIELMALPGLAGSGGDERIGWDHVALSLGSEAAVDALAERCAAENCLVSPPRLTGDGFYEAVIAAPDGTRVEITS